MGDTWYVDEVLVTFHGRRQYLWRSVDQDGDVLDIFVQPRRDRRAAARFFHKVLKGQSRSPPSRKMATLLQHQRHRTGVPELKFGHPRTENRDDGIHVTPGIGAWS
jgi:transposase-like protein